MTDPTKKIMRRTAREVSANLENPATKLVSREEAEERVSADLKENHGYMGLRVFQAVNDPGGREAIRRMLEDDVDKIKAAIRDTKLATEIHELNPPQITSRMRSLVERYGDRYIPVAKPGERHEPRTKWLYAKRFRHAKPSDIGAILTERQVGVSVDQDAMQPWETLDAAWRRANSSAYLRDAELEMIF